jgi:tetratricopeptide (TPR) repeat protein
MAAHAGGWVLHPNSPTPRRVDPGASMNWTGVSPDGRWVAFGLNEGGVSVYDAATGVRVWQSPADGHNYCRFSGDGRWLLTDVDNCRLFAVNSWEPGPQLGSGTPWDTTPELAVLGQSNGVYRLVELATGRELARLEDQERNAGPAVFSPDGTRLVVAAENGLRVWDLRRIRAGLTAMDLDWDAPPYPKADDAGNGPPLEVTIDRGDIDPWPRRAEPDELRRKGDLAGALAAIRQAHAVSPDDANHDNYLAYMLALCPDPKLRDANRAVELATKAVATVPGRWEYWRTLGIAQHVAGEEKAAVRALTRSLELRPDGEAFDYFPLAAAHQQLGNKEEARKWYDRGVAWMATHKHPYAAELSLLRADAEQRLGLGNVPVQRRNERSGR